MAVKEFIIFSSLVAISIINSNIVGSGALIQTPAPVNPQLNQQFSQMKKDLYDLVERLYNLISDVQKLQDMQIEYLEGDVDFSAIARADKEVTQTQNQFISSFMKYLMDSDAYLPGYNYLYPELYRPIKPTLYSPAIPTTQIL